MQYDPSSQQYVPAQQYAPARRVQPRWSALAITAFVMSLLGFLGFTAILGIILGIAGIVAARGGRKRGMGLAIAAIPISLVTGVLSLLLLFSLVVVMRYAEIPSTLSPALKADDPSGTEAIAAIRSLAGSSFNQDVPDAQLAAWLQKVRETHGRLVDLDPDQTMPYTQSADSSTFNFDGKFVNGPAPVRITLRPEGIWSMKFDDIDIGGLSPRDDE
jgi:hypothetical protein